MMHKVKFIVSGTTIYPNIGRPEVVFVGRSNAGKSSFINAMAGQKVAKVSGTPGKTTLLNFFTIGSFYALTDTPGYGYAARSRSETTHWKAMLEKYLSSRQELVGMVLIMDIRRNWSEDEDQLRGWCEQHGLPLCVVLNKADKLRVSEKLKQTKKITQASKLSHLFQASSTKNVGVKAVEAFVYGEWVKLALDKIAEEEALAKERE